MLVSGKFLTESTGEKIVKIGQYLAKIWTKYDSLLFWATLYTISLAGASQASLTVRQTRRLTW